MNKLPVEYDYRKLKGRTVEVFGSGWQSLAKAIGMCRPVMYRKVNSEVDFSQSQIVAICDALDIPYDQIGTYFFKLKSPKKS